MRSPSLSLRWSRVFLLLAGLAAMVRAADAPPAKDPVIELPKYVVTDSRDLPPPESWRYAEIPGFEILTNASDKATIRLIKDFQMFNSALGVVWPALQVHSVVPMSLILCGKGGKFDAFVPVSATKLGSEQGLVSLFLKDNERSAIVLDFEQSVLNITATDGSTGTTGVETSGMQVDHYKQLYREYVHYLLSRTQPRSPAWLEEGLAQLIMGMQFDTQHIEFAKLEDPNTVSIAQATAAQQNADAAAAGDVGTATAPAEDRDFQAALANSALMAFPAMFAVKHDSALARNPIGSSWAKQCYAFVHMCLYGENKRYQKGFGQFVIRIGKEAPTEQLFKECFGMGFSSMGIALRGYVQGANYVSNQWNATKGKQIFAEPPPIVLRDATESEVGRIKGEAMQLAGRMKESRLALIAPYSRGERDPRLLAALGLYERAAKDDERARKFLEAAVTAKVVRPRAYLELATLRFDAAKAKPAGGEDRISADQAAGVLRLLFTARPQPPPMPELYELIAATWSRCALAPTKDNLGVLFEGVRMFPRRSTLVYDTAQLCAKNGFTLEASQLSELGLRVATDDETKLKFTVLKASLPELPAAPAPAPAAAQPEPAKKS